MTFPVRRLLLPRGLLLRPSQRKERPLQEYRLQVLVVVVSLAILSLSYETSSSRRALCQQRQKRCAPSVAGSRSLSEHLN